MSTCFRENSAGPRELTGTFFSTFMGRECWMMRIKAKDPRLVLLTGEFMRVYLPCVRNRDAVRDHFLLSLLYESGARINEVLSLRLLDGCETKVRKDNPDLIHLQSHLFRRTRARHPYQAGVPLPTISEWLGHSNIETTRFYAKVTEEMKREALHKLSDSDSSVFKDDVAFKYANNKEL